MLLRQIYLSGVSDGIRTRDHCDHNAALYTTELPTQLSHQESNLDQLINSQSHCHYAMGDRAGLAGVEPAPNWVGISYASDTPQTHWLRDYDSITSRFMSMQILGQPGFEPGTPHHGMIPFQHWQLTPAQLSTYGRYVSPALGFATP